MKFLMAMGGFFAFAAVSVAGFVVQRDPGRIVMEAAIAAVIAALLIRWLYGLFARSVKASVEEKRMVHIQEAAAEAMKKTASASPKS